MPSFERRADLPATAEEIYAWHARPGAFDRLVPPWERIEIRSRSGSGLDVGVQIELSVPPSPIALVSRHTAHATPEEYRARRAPWAGFVDEQVSGPFARWRHEHRFTDQALVDHVDFAPPLGLGGGLVTSRLARTFAFRHARTRLDLARHAAVRDRPRLRVLLAGGSGLVGRELAAFLATGGHDVVLLSRRPAGPTEPFAVRVWDPRDPLDPAMVDGFDAVFNLAGEPIGGRWTAERRVAIERSRVGLTEALVRAILAAPRRPRVLLSGSAVGWYGDRGDDVLDETSAAGEGFLAGVALGWEAAALAAAGVRVVLLRTGIVLSARGGYLGPMVPLARVGGLGPVGGGRQWVPWIAIDDWVGAAHFLLCRDDIDGPVNLTAPAPARQRDLATALGRVLSRPAILPTPAAAVSVVLGAAATRELVLASQRATPAKLLASGFAFAHADLDAALRFELGR